MDGTLAKVDGGSSYVTLVSHKDSKGLEEMAHSERWSGACNGRVHSLLCWMVGAGSHVVSSLAN